jgi:hypothetical protein
MNLDLSFLFLNLNAVVTLFVGLIILYFLRIERLEKNIFYYSWSLGFILYSVQIFGRTYGFFPNLASIGLVMFPTLFLFLLGLWSLSKKRVFMYIVILNLILLGGLSVLYIFDFVSLDLALFVGEITWYLPVVIGVFYHRMVFGRNVDKFVLGWLLLFFSNVFFLDQGWIGDVFGLTSKLIILLGILDYDFVIFTQRIQKNIESELPPVYTGDVQEGGVKLVIQNVNSKKCGNLMRGRTNWMFEKIEENTKNGFFSYLFAFQDVTSHKSLRRLKWIKPERVFVFLFSNSDPKLDGEFTVLSMGLTQIGATLSEIIKEIGIKQKSRPDQRYVVIFDNLSLLIHKFGVQQVYNLLLDKMGALRAKNIELFAIFEPETHSDQSITPLFKSISDEIVNF